ncbi:glycoside hydrolase family 48 protein [Cellulomonas timonensis]|uniref:glycoside hydrolase family 48 protein n=1 Tax=Cellulomonas timonensis TaxID=1689271 RepID=UPI00082AB1F3|nr:glycoside hydrolase family 48 protein [Cellulomonas timonensis]
MSRHTRRRSPWLALAAGGAASCVAWAGIGPAFAAPPAPAAVVAAAPVKTAVTTASTEYAQRFLDLYNEIHDPANGYFSPQGIPYHSIETLIVEAPDYGHETTSEAYSFWMWLEASYGQVTGDWEPFNAAWTTMEKYMIPQAADQPTNSFYDPSKPATYAAEYDHPSKYPSQINSGVASGVDPIGAELKSTYGTSDVYGMHWIADVDNKYGFGGSPGGGCNTGPASTGTSYINTFQRGTQESVWETITQPSCDNFKYGGTNGYLDLFTKDASYAKQWKYTNAPDADARAIEAAYWAHTWATAQGNESKIAATVAKAAKMGDYLRYSLFDKYFKKIGCTAPSCAAGTGRDSAHYLQSWYYAWGGATDTSAGWAWRIGSSTSHFGYQNPMSAWALSNVSVLTPKSPTAKDDWSKSLDRQLEFYQWLQSAEGGIAGGATNSWGGGYGAPPAGTSTFYGMGYQVAPVYSDPPSNQWFGMQVWSMERVAELYYATGDARAKKLLDKWVPWAIANTEVNANGTWAIPATLGWSGQPDTWNATSPGTNAGLHVTVVDKGQDVGIAGDYAKLLTYYGAKSGNAAAKSTAKALLDVMWENNRDDKGISTTETREDYKRFDDVMTGTTGDGVYVPSGWSGKMPNGDAIKPGVSFLDIRSWYKNDPDWPKVQAYLDGGPAPKFNYHRFWAQAAIATAMADYDRLLGTPTTPDTTAPTVPTGLTSPSKTATSVSLSWTASTDAVGVTGYDVYRGTTLVGTATGTTYTDTGLTASTAYSYTVRAKDAAGNISAASTALAVTTSATGGDTTAPTVPTGLTSPSKTSTSVSLSWTASSDAVGVAGYDVYRGATLVGTATGTTYTDTGLTASTAYSYTVRAKDAAGNISAPSTALSVTTNAGPTPTPTVTTAPTSSCKVTYTANSWNTGFTASVKVTNTGTTALSGWTLGFAFPSGQKVTQGWSANWSQSGTQVTAANAAWNGSLAAGASVDIGFNGSHTGVNTAPSAFTVNGATCS